MHTEGWKQEFWARVGKKVAGACEELNVSYGVPFDLDTRRIVPDQPPETVRRAAARLRLLGSALNVLYADDVSLMTPGLPMRLSPIWWQLADGTPPERILLNRHSVTEPDGTVRRASLADRPALLDTYRRAQLLSPHLHAVVLLDPQRTRMEMRRDHALQTSADPEAAAEYLGRRLSALDRLRRSVHDGDCDRWLLLVDDFSSVNLMYGISSVEATAHSFKQEKPISPRAPSDGYHVRLVHAPTRLSQDLDEVREALWAEAARIVRARSGIRLKAPVDILGRDLRELTLDSIERLRALYHAVAQEHGVKGLGSPSEREATPPSQGSGDPCWRVSTSEGQVCVNGRPLELRGQPLALLSVLLKDPRGRRQGMTSQEIAQRIGTGAGDGAHERVKRLIYKVRQALELVFRDGTAAPRSRRLRQHNRMFPLDFELIVVGEGYRLRVDASVELPHVPSRPER